LFNYLNDLERKNIFKKLLFIISKIVEGVYCKLLPNKGIKRKKKSSQKLKKYLFITKLVSTHASD